MKRFLALLLALSLCFGMLPMPGSAEAAEETQEAVLAENIPDETVEAAEPTEPSEEVLEETFAAEEALPESGPTLVITEQPEDTLTVEGVAYFAVFARVEQDGQALEAAEVHYQWQYLDGDIWVALEGETGEILAAEAPEVGDTYRCLVTWEDLEAVSEAAAVVGEEAPLEMASAVWINPAYRDLYSEEDFSDSFEISTNASAISCSSREAALAAIRAAMVKRESVITLDLNYSYGSLDDEVEALVAHMYDHNGDPKQGDYLGYAVGGYRYGWGGRQFFLQDIAYYTTAAQELQADAAVERILASLNLDGKTELQKINAIYDWLVRNVTYDYANLNNDRYKAKYAGYAALVDKTAVCQGFAGAFYRLCLEVGVDSRIISSQNMNHAWNIVRVGDWYYHVDATWDINTPDSLQYYLKGTVNWLKEHKSSTTNYISELGDQFGDASFAASYPVPTEDYRETEEEGYTIAFDGNTAEELLGSMTPIQALWDADVTLSQCNFTVFGYTFTGWNTQADGKGKTYQPGDTVRNLAEEGTVTLYAQWKANTYRLVFLPGAEDGTYIGSTNAMEGLVNGETYQMPAGGYSRLGYTFAGWYEEEWPDDLWQPGEDFRFTKVEQGAEIVFIAKWKINTYQAVFLPGTDAGDYTGSVKPMEGLESGKTYVLPKNGYTRPGYTFAGWSLTGQEKIQEPGEEFTFTQTAQGPEVTYLARWTPITYTVRYNANKGTGRMADQKDISYDASTELAKNEFTRKGYHFIGWNTKANGTGEEVEEAYQLTTTNKGTVTLYAMWEANEYTVVFHGANGETATQTMTYDQNEVLGPNPFKKAGYTFAKWNTQENGKGKAYANNAKVKNLSTGEEEVDLYAQWTPNQYTVEFHSNFGTKDTVKKQTLTFDAKETALTSNSFTWKGHTFLGWADEDDVTYEDKQPVRNLTTDKTIALYAQWKVNEYTVVFDGNGAGQADVEQPMTYDEEAALYKNTFTRPGYDFSGWATTAKGKAAYTDGKQVKNLTEKDGVEIRLYAVWTPYTYTVTFAPGAEAVTGKTADMKKLANGKQYAPKSCGFKRPGYVFDGWMLPDGKVITTKEKFSDLGETKDEVVTLTATWKPITYKIRFNANKGTGKVEDETGILYDVPRQLSGKAFFRKGYTFLGWNTKANGTGTSYDRDATVEKLTTVNNGTVTLYAQWEANSYKVYFNANGGEGEMEPITMVYDKAVKLPKNTFRSNATFMGWSTSWNGKVMYKDAASVKNLSDGSSVMLFAVWKYPEKDNGNLQKVDYPASGNALYDEILEKNITEVLYRDELGYERRQEEKLSNIYNEYGIMPNNMKYTYRDLDQDGVSELIIFEGAEAAWDSVVYAIYSIRDDQLLFPVNGWARNRYYICQDKKVVCWGSGGAAYTLYARYGYENCELNLEECYFTTDQRGDNHWFYSKVEPYDANAEPISEELFDERTLELMSNCITLEGRTFLDYLRQDEAAVRYEISIAKQTEDALNRQLQGKNLLQAEKDSIAQEKLELWDNALNQLLRILKYRLSREDAKKLTAEQNEWITQRTAAGQKAAQGKGDAATFYNYGAQADYTRNRTLNLLAKLGN